MQEEFEKKVRERVHTFGIQPSPQVWDDIDAVLNKQKHRRVFVGWWILLGLVIMAGIVLLYEKDNIISRGGLNQQPLITDTTNNTNNNAKTKEKNKANLVKPNDTATVETEKASQTGAGTRDKMVTAGNEKKTTKRAEWPGGRSGLFTFNSRMVKASGAALPQNRGVTQDNTEQTIQGAVAKNTTTKNTTPNAGRPITGLPPALLNSNGDTSAQIITGSPDGVPRRLGTQLVPDKLVLPLSAMPDSAVVTAPANEKTAAPGAQNTSGLKKFGAPKGHEWFLTLHAGSTQTVSSGAFGTNAPASYALSPSALNANIPAITSLNAYNYNISQPGAGFNVGAGVLYEKNLSARWKLYGGITANYLSNTQKVGAYNKAELSISAGNYSSSGVLALSGGVGQLTLQSSYNAGNDATLVNKAWQMEVPAGIGYVFNPKSKTKLMVNAGASVAWFFSSEWLIPDARYDKLYYSKTVFNSTAFTWQLGPAVQLASGLKFGLQYQQSFGTLAKDYVTPQLHWQNISIYTAIPLGRRKKH